jgi:hypothetical protein
VSVYCSVCDIEPYALGNVGLLSKAVEAKEEHVADGQVEQGLAIDAIDLDRIPCV